ncbi:hypothetical protein LINPERHAP1_LOCUS17454 [Linum perenne]
MAAALLSISSFLPSKNGDNYGLSGNLKKKSTSLYGQVLCSPNPTRMRINSIQRGRTAFFVASLLGRKKAQKKETVIPDPDYRIPIVLLGTAGGLAYVDNLLPAVPIGLLGLLLLFQTTRVRFVFDSEALEVRVGEELDESGENAFVGGKNRWKYSTFVNWELWWPNFPILVYFKETQTKREGQIHFFPVIFVSKANKPILH